jgi:sodium-dependent dicarboxylate transporter 2/3/5
MLRLLWDHLRPNLIPLGVALLFVLGYLGGWYENLFGLTDSAAIALTMLLITALFWVTETFPLYITSMGVLALSVLWLLPNLPAEAATDGKAPFFQAFFGDITLLFMGGFVLSALLNKYGLAQRMASWVIRQTGSKPSNVLFGLIAISAVLSMWMSNTATAAMMFAIIGPVVLHIPAGSTFAKGMALSIPFACNIGGLGTPIGTPPNAIALEYLAQAGIELSFAKWMMISMPLLILLLLALWWLLLRLYPPGDFQLEMSSEEEEYSGFTVRQYLVIGIFGLTIMGWLTGGWTGLSTGMVGLLCLLASFGMGLLKTPDFRNISWDILFMLGGGLCLGVCLNSSGLTSAIANAIPMEEGFWVVFGLMLLLAAAMTTFMSNTATANLLIPVAISLSGNELLLSIAIAVMCSTAMALPVSTPPNAIAFGSGWLEAKDMLRAGLIITLLALMITLVASIFYIPLFLVV